MFETLGTSDVEWAGKTYPEVNERAARPGSVLLVPVGSLEQHGRHLPTSTDTILVSAVVQRAAERADDVPVIAMPTIPVGYSPHHLAFGGVATVEHDNLISVLEDAADSALETGFDAVLFVNGHGGNAAVVGSATRTVGSANPDAEVLGFTYFDLGSDRIDEVRDSDPGGAGHAGEVETSMIMHLRPELVREDEIEGTRWETPYDGARNDLTGAGAVSEYVNFDTLSESGCVGEPELATAEKGERFFEIFVEELADVISQAHDAALE